MNHAVQLAEVARIAEQLAILCDDDERLFADMLEGETDLHAIVGKLHEQIASDNELVAGITQRQAELAERKRRLTDRVTATKAGIGKFLRAAMLAKIELPEATYSVRDGKESLRVVDAEAVPPELCRTKVEPDKTAINLAFAEVDALPNWLTREPARDVVTMRTK
jgi:hypothetical protein